MLSNTLRRFHFGVRSLLRRLRRDGVAPTWEWLHGHVWPCLTGIPSLRFGRVTQQLFVGPQISWTGKQRLKRLGVRASVNLRAEFDDAAFGLALDDYLWLPTIDGDPPTLDQLAEGVAFVGRVLATGGRVYIHCQSGVGRAPTLAAAFLVSGGMALREAVALLQKARPFVDLTPSQLDQLARFVEEGKSA